MFVYFDVDKRDGPIPLEVGGQLGSWSVGYNILQLTADVQHGLVRSALISNWSRVEIWSRCKLHK